MGKDKFFKKYESPKWQKKKTEILEREDYTCQECGSTEDQLQVHHNFYKPDADPWDYDNDDLRCLCKNCHKEITRLIKKIKNDICNYNLKDLNSIENFIYLYHCNNVYMESIINSIVTMLQTAYKNGSKNL